MISPIILAAAAKVAEHSARRSTPSWGVSEDPSAEHRVPDAAVADTANAAPPSSRRLIRKKLELVSTPTR